jgi:predicted nucleic acid-binding protein
VSGVVADTSEWVEYLAGRPAADLDHALSIGAVVLSPIVVAELVSGTKSLKERRALIDLLSDLVVHDTPLAHWIRVGELRGRLRAQGLSVSTPDAHVAQCALDREARLLTRDRIFSKVATLCPLRLG